MVWGGISYEARTDLVMFDRGSVNAARYVVKVWQDHWQNFPFGPFIGKIFLLMHDNACAHTAQLTTQYLNEVGI